jgi:hypothetical protein
MPLKGKRLATGHEARAIIERELSDGAQARRLHPARVLDA